jgi:ADP-heptose:LPS heptosyltransferase
MCDRFIDRPMHLANASNVKCAFKFGGSDINETSPNGARQRVKANLRAVRAEANANMIRKMS